MHRARRKLQRFLGRRLGLFAALVVAGVRFRRLRRSGRVPSLREAIALLFNAVATLCGTSAVCIDPRTAARSAAVLEPLTALGPRHIATWMHEYCCTLAATVRDRYGVVYPRWQRIIARLSSDEEIRGMAPSLRRRYLGGALYASGVMESQCDDSRALHTAERLEQIGLELYRSSADQIRTNYYANRGDLARYEQFRARAEQNAIQSGTLWQVETWAPSAATTASLRTHDAMRMKRASEQLARLSPEIPSFESYDRRARGSYLVLRKRYAEALPWLESCLHEEPCLNIGWARTHGTLARAYNGLGQHERALSTCERVRMHLGDADFAFVALNLFVECEQLVALAGLGRVEQALAGLATLLSRHAAGSPLTLGQLHETGVEIALLAKDAERAQQHFAAMAENYRATGVPSLVQLCETLGARVFGRREGELRYGLGGESTLDSYDAQNGATSAMVTISRMIAGGTMSKLTRAQKALQILAERTRSGDGHLFVLDDSASLQHLCSLGEAQVEPEVEAALRTRVERELEEEETQLSEHEFSAQQPADVLEHAGRHHRLILLLTAAAKHKGVVGAVVVSSPLGPPQPCEGEIVSAIAYHLERAQRSGTTESALLTASRVRSV